MTHLLQPTRGQQQPNPLNSQVQSIEKAYLYVVESQQCETLCSHQGF